MCSWPPSVLFREVVKLTRPPIGIYINTSECLKRCELFTYSLVEEPIPVYSRDLDLADLYVYFGSPSLEVWTEYRLMSFLDFVVGVGGAVGLILGMSALSILDVLAHWFANGHELGIVKSRRH